MLRQDNTLRAMNEFVNKLEMPARVPVSYLMWTLHVDSFCPILKISLRVTFSWCGVDCDVIEFKLESCIYFFASGDDGVSIA